ncbi:NrsF family protein [Roseococcus sp. YIM B11640]|uniref:NrsF family protein n=1 Tax=Roseococcus sp. YIM B11640 TaxID=3133973 RepID=UPI003C7A0EDD
MKTEDLVTRLASDLRPVRRLPSPSVMLCLWTGFCTLVILAALWMLGMRKDVMEDGLARIDFWHMATAGLVALFSGFAAFQLALPDRDRRWALLPLPAIAAWLATMGWGCLADFTRLGAEGLRLTTSLPCLGFILGLGVPMTLGMVWLTRHAALLRPLPVATLGGLSAAAFASLGLTLVHELNASVMVLVWHGLAVLVVTALGAMAGPLLMQRAN